MSSDDANDRDKRRNGRVAVGFPAEFRSGKKSGRGLVRDLSDLGAWIDRPSRSLSQGARLTLKLRLGHNAVELGARVVRSSRAGFAVHFDAPDGRLQHLLQVSRSRQSVKR